VSPAPPSQAVPVTPAVLHTTINTLSASGSEAVAVNVTVEPGLIGPFSVKFVKFGAAFPVVIVVEPEIAIAVAGDTVPAEAVICVLGLVICKSTVSFACAPEQQR